MKSGPQHFHVDLVRTSDGQGRLEAGSRPGIVGGAPPEFGGSPDVWSPEHLLVSATALCFYTTLEWFARRSNLAIDTFRCAARGTVEKTAGGLAFTSMQLDVAVTVPAGETARANDLLETAKRSCLVANSLRPPVELVARVEEAAAPGGGAARFDEAV